MADTTVTKVDPTFSPRGAIGQKYLASGVHIAMPLWEDEPAGRPKAATKRPYEIVGSAIKGKDQLEIEGQTVLLEPGNSWVVPQGALSRYTILQPFTAVEATYPPAQVHRRDET